MVDLFGPDGPELNEIYRILRSPSSGKRQEVRQYIDRLWEMYEPYAEPDFVSEFALQISQRYWEMYLACVFLDMGFPLERNRGKQPRPDIKTRAAGTTMWVEAVSPTPGEVGRPDTVPRVRLHSEMVAAGEEPVANTVPIDQIVLRCANAFDQKKRVSDKYIRGGIIKKGDINLIAISGAEAMNWHLGDGKRYALGCVLGVGPQYLTMSSATGKIIDGGFTYRDVVKKAAGSEVVTDCFFRDEYRDIGGLIFCATSIGNSPEKLGADLITVHNPRANEPLPRETIPRGIECWVRQEQDRFYVDQVDHEHGN